MVVALQAIEKFRIPKATSIKLFVACSVPPNGSKKAQCLILKL